MGDLLLNLNGLKNLFLIYGSPTTLALSKRQADIPD